MYQFEKIIGNDLIIKAMQSAIYYNKVSHSYIFEGPPLSGKNLISKTFAKTLQCEEENINPCDLCISCTSFENNNHPDIIYVVPNKTKSIGVDDIREQVTTLCLIRPFKYKFKIFIFENADLLTTQAQNALLKTIEEPPSFAIFIFMSTNIGNFLPTILSRSITYKIRPISNDLISTYLKNISKDLSIDTEILSAYADGNIGKALKMANDIDFFQIRDDLINILERITSEGITDTFLHYKFFEENKDIIFELLELITIFYRDALLYSETQNQELIIQKDKINVIIKISKNHSTINLIKKIDFINITKENLRCNANYQMAIEVMLLKLKEK